MLGKFVDPLQVAEDMAADAFFDPEVEAAMAAAELAAAGPAGNRAVADGIWTLTRGVVVSMRVGRLGRYRPAAVKLDAANGWLRWEWQGTEGKARAVRVISMVPEPDARLRLTVTPADAPNSTKARIGAQVSMAGPLPRHTPTQSHRGAQSWPTLPRPIVARPNCSLTDPTALADPTNGLL